MTPPTPPDDDSIPDDEYLYRRIPNAASPDFITTDAVTGARAPSSSVFKTRDDDGMSVYLDSVLTAHDLGPTDLVRAPMNAVCSVLAGAARQHDLGVVRDPWPAERDDPDHPRHGAHALITGMNSLGSKAARHVARRLARDATIVVDPVA